MGDLKKAIHKPRKFYGCIASNLFLGHFLEMGEILGLPSLQIFSWVTYTSLLASVHQPKTQPHHPRKRVKGGSPISNNSLTLSSQI
jgi:hypothetical protein